MSARATVKVLVARVTADAKKLWSCEEILRTTPEHKGKLPKSSGQAIHLLLPGETPSSFCQAKRAWQVVPEDQAKYSPTGVGYKVCEHQVDIEDE